MIGRVVRYRGRREISVCESRATSGIKSGARHKCGEAYLPTLLQWSATGLLRSNESRVLFAHVVPRLEWIVGDIEIDDLTLLQELGWEVVDLRHEALAMDRKQQLDTIAMCAATALHSQ